MKNKTPKSCNCKSINYLKSAMFSPHKLAVMLVLVWCLQTAHTKSYNRHKVEPKSCKWERLVSDNKDSIKTTLSCKLRTLSVNENLLQNLSAYQKEQIASLKLECNDILFYESSLESNLFAGTDFLGTLKNLRELNIEYCKIRHVPAMILSSSKNLHSLALQTHNNDWPAMNLEFHPEAFFGMTDLRVLNLADNNIWSLPSDIFCPLHSLKRLNLTNNHLNDVAQLGFSDWGNGPMAPGKACNSGLEVLDLSRNDIVSLPNNGLSALRSLIALNLQENDLSALADRSFVGLGALKLLNMSHNKMVALPPELFQSPRGLQQIYLQNNSLSVLAPGLLEGLDHLEVLDLSKNDLTSVWVNRNTFAGLIRLVVLNLGHNQLSKIDAHVFGGLFSLQLLNLQNNAIEFIDDNAFADLKNLHVLTLSNNRLKEIEIYDFSSLFVLNQLLLDGNQISNVHPQAFENLTNLNDLRLRGNALTEIPEGLGPLRFLKSLDLSHNHITKIHNTSFGGHLLVENLNLSSIQELNLGSNRIKQIDRYAFGSNPNIRAIRLDDNRIEEIGSIFASLSSLMWLNISANYIRKFDFNELPTSLEWLDLHQNNITELTHSFEEADENSLKLKMLDVSFNEITTIDGHKIPDSIEVLFLNNNLLTDVAPGTFLKKAHLEKVVLYGNFIQKFEISALAISYVSLDRDIPQFFIGDNPIHCDCGTMEWLSQINEIANMRQYPHIMDLGSVMCHMSNERAGSSVQALLDLNSPQDFLCKYDTHCFALCHCCDYDACDCEMTCPDKCNCYHDHTWSTNIVDCGNSGYNRSAEQVLPMDATAIYLDGNDLKYLTSHMFLGKKKLLQLYLNQSNVHHIHNRTFNGLTNLKVLHLEENALKEIRGDEFDQLFNLNELHLQSNSIATIGKRAFKHMKYLRIVNINDNRIVDFDPINLLSAAYDTGFLSRVTFEGNKVFCSCSQLRQLTKWIGSLPNDEIDTTKIICTDNQFVNDVIEICEASTTAHGGILRTQALQHRGVHLASDPGLSGQVNNSYVSFLATVLVALIGTGLIVALVCVFRGAILVWLHSRYGVRLQKDRVLNNKDHILPYDILIISSNAANDADFVRHMIQPELQRSGLVAYPFHRNHRGNETLSGRLQSAASVTKKVVIVLSLKFLHNEWKQQEYSVAIQSMIHSINPAHRRSKLLLIATTPLELLTLDPTLRILLQTCNVLFWGEKRFWAKFKYALPDALPTHCTKEKDISNCCSTYNLNKQRYTSSPSCAYPTLRSLALNYQNAYNFSVDDVASMVTQHYEVPLKYDQVYCNRPTGSLGHVYSTIPEMMPAPPSAEKVYDNQHFV